MRVLLSVLAAGVLSVATMSSASADPLTKAEIAEVLSDQGYAVIDDAPNRLRLTVGENAMYIIIGGPDGDITYITYLRGFDPDSVGYQFLSKFNSEVKFGRVYIDRDGDLALQMDRNAAGGITTENVESDFEVFRALIDKFLSDVENQLMA